MKPDLRFGDFVERLEKMHTEPWLPIYGSYKRDGFDIFYFCALLNPEAAEKALGRKDWELKAGEGMPSHIFYGAEEGNFRYSRFGDGEVEPFVFHRSFHGLHDSFEEISEEFRHYFNLAPADRGNKLVQYDDSGDPVDVVRGINSETVEVRLNYLKKYLAIKGMTLVVYFSLGNRFPETLEILGLQEFTEYQIGKDYAYEVWAKAWEGYSTGDGIKTFAGLIGKKLIEGNPEYKPKFIDDEEQNYEEFIIGTDENGEPKYYSSDQERLSDYFGKNPGAPHYLTPVFFNRDVLKRYYDDSRYRVEDGNLRCAALWGLRMDNNHPKYVIAYLGDLGHLPHKHQHHWKSFNVLPDGSISDTAFRRGFLAEFADATRPDLVFKARIKDFAASSLVSLGWYIFKPLTANDEHLFDSLHIPKDGDQKDFDEQVLALAKILIDSLNNKGLVSRPEVKTKDGQSIAMLSEWVSEVIPGAEHYMDFLRKLQALRSAGVAHRKSDNYGSPKTYFKIEELGFEKSFETMLNTAIEMLEVLRTLFV